MFNDDGLGEAMAHASARDRTKNLEKRVEELEKMVEKLSKKVNYGLFARR